MEKEVREKLMHIVTSAVNSAMIEFDEDCCHDIDNYEAQQTADCMTEMLIDLFKNEE